jgi:hypothetical protein
MEMHAKDVARIESHIAELVAERQRMRDDAAEQAELERNRAEIVRCQWELSAALIACHRPASVPAAA